MIVINGRFLTQRITGVQRFAIEMCERISNKIGNEKVVLIVPNEDFVLSLENSLEIIHIGKFKGQLWEQFDLPNFLKKNDNPLLINFTGIGPVYYKNKIMFLYDLAFKHHPEWFSFLFQKSYNTLIPISIKYSKRVITDSNYVKQDIIKTYKVSDSKIHVIYASYSKMFINQNLKREKIILTVSSIDPRKNLGNIISAFSKLNYDYKLVIVGSKSKTFSKFHIQDELITKNIIFTGYLSDESIVELYNKAEIFIYASLFEGFGIPPLEAQSCGLPCVVSNTTSLPEVYVDSVSYCDPYSIQSIRDQLNMLIENDDKQRELIKRGFENIERFSWDDSARKLEKIIYEESINP